MVLVPPVNPSTDELHAKTGKVRYILWAGRMGKSSFI